MSKTRKREKNVSDFSEAANGNSVIIPRTESQKVYLDALRTHTLNIAVGPAGTGKTYVAVGHAVDLLRSGKIKKIVCARRALEAGDPLGALPGNADQKVAPYLRPVIDALTGFLGYQEYRKRLESRDIELGSLELMRGMTYKDSLILVDEAQNLTRMQMRMILTRVGEGSFMVVDGDPSQSDLRRGEESGLLELLWLLDHTDLGKSPNVHTTVFTDRDVVRSQMAAEIVAAYAQHDRSTGVQAVFENVGRNNSGGRNSGHNGARSGSIILPSELDSGSGVGKKRIVVSPPDRKPS